MTKLKNVDQPLWCQERKNHKDGQESSRLPSAMAVYH